MHAAPLTVELVVGALVVAGVLYAVFGMLRSNGGPPRSSPRRRPKKSRPRLNLRLPPRPLRHRTSDPGA